MAEAKESFEQWALVELFGHQRIAGRVSEAEIGGGKFIRVDVPAVKGRQPVTKLYGPAAIYGISILTEETATAMATQIDPAPFIPYDARLLLTKDRQRMLGDSEEDVDNDLS